MELHDASFLSVPDARVTGSVDVAWIEGGSALAIRQGDSAHPPAAVWIVGRDEGDPEYSMLYADDRGVSRIYRMTFKGSEWSIWRDTVTFSQRFTASLDGEQGVIRGRWEKSADEGETWEHDFNIDYILEAAPDSNT